MRTICVLTITCLLAGMCSATDVEVPNAGFEEGSGEDAADWTENNARRTDAAARTGSHSMELPEIGEEWYPNATQELPAAPGEKWTLTAWFMTPEKDPLLGDELALAKIEWVGTEEYAESEVRITSNDKHDKWIKASATAEAPEGTTAVRLVVVRVYGSGDGTVYVDDVTARKR